MTTDEEFAEGAAVRHRALIAFARANDIRRSELVVIDRDGLKLARVVDHDWHETAWQCVMIATWGDNLLAWIPIGPQGK